METIDRLDALLERFSVRARQFHLGPLCDVSRFDVSCGRGFLHILRAGSLVVADGPRLAERVVSQPSVLFYPRPHEHVFYARPEFGVDLACAILEFDGGADNPLVRALPEVLTVPIAQVPGLDGSLGLLFEEIDDYRCGRRLIVDRLFEVSLLKLLRWMLDRPDEIGLPPGMLSGMADPQIARSLTAMHEDPGAEWTLDSLSRVASMSRSAFAARFRDAVGATPHDYLTSWRMALAQKRLREGVPVSQIAAELGYTSSSFSRVFAQREGCSPRAWVERRAEITGRAGRAARAG